MRNRLFQKSVFPRRRLGAEHLEARDLLAGDVLVTKSGTTLNLTATGNTANDVVIAGSETPGTYTVYGVDLDASGDATRINGAVRDFDVGGRTYTGIRFISVNLNGGNDNLFLTNVAASEGVNRLQGLTINMGAGNDNVVIGGPLTIDTDFVGDATVGGNIETNSGTVDLRGVATILTGAGNDTLTIRGLNSTRLVNALLEAGNDTATLSDVTTSETIVNFAAGHATFTGSNLTTTVGNLTVTAPASSTSDVTVGIETLDVAGSVIINTGASEASVTVSSGDINFDLAIMSFGAAGNNNTVAVSGLTIGAVATITTGQGNDEIDFAESTADILQIFSNAGNDRIDVLLSNFEESNQIARVAVIISGEGNDGVTIGAGVEAQGSVAFDFLTVDLLGGDDALNISNTTVGINAFFSGGAGFDTYNDDGSNDFQGTYTRILFEDEPEEPEEI